MAFKRLFATFKDKYLEQLWHELNRRIDVAIRGSSDTIVYRPGAPSSGNAVATWEEVMEFLGQVEGATVYVDTSRQTPIGTPAPVPPGVYNLRFAQLGSVLLPTGIVVLDVQDGAVLQNLKGITDGLELRVHPSAAPCFTYPDQAGVPQVFAAYRGALIDNQGSVPAIEVASGEFFVVAGTFSGFVGPQGGVCSQPIVNAADGAIVACVDNFGVWSQNWLSGEAGATLVYTALGPSFPEPPPALPSFLGSVVFGPDDGNLSRSPRVVYSPAVPADWSGSPPSTVQEAFDRIAAAIGPIA